MGSGLGTLLLLLGCTLRRKQPFAVTIMQARLLLGFRLHHVDALLRFPLLTSLCKLTHATPIELSPKNLDALVAGSAEALHEEDGILRRHHFMSSACFVLQIDADAIEFGSLVPIASGTAANRSVYMIRAMEVALHPRELQQHHSLEGYEWCRCKTHEPWACLLRALAFSQQHRQPSAAIAQILAQHDYSARVANLRAKATLCTPTGKSIVSHKCWNMLRLL